LPSIQIANAQDTCQDGTESIIGSDDQSEYEAERVGGRLYLNTDNPAQCSGFITQLEYCYYPPESDDNNVFNRVYFAIYRQLRNFLYVRQTAPIPVLLGGFIGGLDKNFSCTTLNVILQVNIQEGDIIGACLPGGNPLNVVSDISDEEHFNANLSYVESDCSSSFAVPLFINEHFTNVGVQESRILHLTLYASKIHRLYSNANIR
jgi:hypothetical protein